MTHPSHQYTQKTYWDERFKTERDFEWLCTWQDLHPLLAPYFSGPQVFSCAILGNGSSRLPYSLSNDYPQATVIATDYSEVVISSCQSHPGNHTNLTFSVADMTALAHSSLASSPHFGGFDVVLDKGALDALVSAEGDDWDPSPDKLEVSHLVCSGVHKALREGGVFIMVSFSQPHFRKRHLLQPRVPQGPPLSGQELLLKAHAGGGEDSDGDEWEADKTPGVSALPPPTVLGSFWSKCEVLTVERGLGYFIYVCTK
jgi:hypothetical protein